MYRSLFSELNFSRCAKMPKVPRGPATRGLQTTVPRRTRYKRFSDSQGEGDSPKNPLDWKHWDPPVKFGVVLAGVVGSYYIAHLEQVPETGRWRFMNTSPKMEAQIGQMVRAQTKHEFGDKILPPDHPLSLHVRKVTSRILSHSNLGRIRGDPPATGSQRPDDVWTYDDNFGSAERDADIVEKEWDVVVVNDRRIVNASASPGLITVFTGILPVCKDEQGLAAVLSHEIAHIVARHGAEALSARTVMIAFGIALQAAGLDWGFSRIIHKLFVDLPNSRTQELEADLIGLRLMSRACYDPKAAPEMFERLGRLSGQSGVDFLNTHPSSTSRVKQLEDALPDAYSILAASPECSAMQNRLEGFKEHTRAIRLDDQGNTEFV